MSEDKNMKNIEKSLKNIEKSTKDILENTKKVQTGDPKHKEVYDFVSGWLVTHYGMENNSRGLLITISGALVTGYVFMYDILPGSYLFVFSLFAGILTTLFYIRLAQNNLHGNYYIKILKDLEKEIYPNIRHQTFSEREDFLKEYGRWKNIKYSTTKLMSFFPFVWFFLFIVSIIKWIS